MKYILWDWNGTLFDDFDICRYTIDKLLTDNGLPTLSSDEEYRRKFCFPITRFYKNLGLDFSKKPFEKLAVEYMDIYIPLSRDKKVCNLNKNAVKTLSAFSKKGYRQYIISASKADVLKSQVGSFGIEKFFAEIAGIGDIYAGSKAEIALEWEKKNGVSPSDIVFIGDSLHDFEISSLLGCRCLLYTGGHQNIPESKGYEKINSLAKAVDLI